jgi:hypothetical protein
MVVPVVGYAGHRRGESSQNFSVRAFLKVPFKASSRKDNFAKETSIKKGIACDANISTFKDISNLNWSFRA